MQDFLPYLAGKRAEGEAGVGGFYRELGQFLLEGEYLRHAEHIVWDRGSGRIRSTRFVVSVKGVPYGKGSMRSPH